MKERVKEKDFEKDVEALKKLEHPHVIRFIGSAEIKGKMYLVMEYMSERSLLEYIRKNEKTVTEAELVEMSLQISSGMIYLGEKGITHQ